MSIYDHCLHRLSSCRSSAAVFVELQHGPFLVEYRVSPYLHDDSSHNIESDGNEVPSFTMPMRRSASLNFVSTDVSETPRMIRMPVHRPFADITETLKIIPRKSWLLPYVIACCPLHVFEGFLMLPFLVDGLSYSTTHPGSANSIPINSGGGVGGGVGDDSSSSSNHDHFSRGTEHIYSDSINHYPCQDHARRNSTQPPNISSLMNDSSSAILAEQDINIMFNSCDTTLVGGSSSTERRHRSLSDLASCQGTYEEFNPLAQPLIYSHGKKASPPPLSFTRPITFPDSWRSLGMVLLSSDPSWCKWEPKIVFLLDTYLIECVNSTTDFKIIGYIQLSDSQIQKITFQNESFKRFNPTLDQHPQFRSQNSFPRGDYPTLTPAVTSSQHLVDSSGVTSSSYGIKISGHKISSSLSEMHTFYLTTIQCFTTEGSSDC